MGGGGGESKLCEEKLMLMGNKLHLRCLTETFIRLEDKHVFNKLR